MKFFKRYNLYWGHSLDEAELQKCCVTYDQAMRYISEYAKERDLGHYFRTWEMPSGNITVDYGSHMMFFFLVPTFDYTAVVTAFLPSQFLSVQPAL